MSVFKCDTCALLREQVEQLRSDLAERDKTLLALYNLPAYRARFPQPKQAAPESEAKPAVVVTPEMSRGMTYTSPNGRDPFEVEADFEVTEPN